MQYVTDLHLHSKYSRAVSPQMNLPVMSQYARQKGFDILTAGDFTHPVWSKEIREMLEERDEGLYGLPDKEDPTRFILSTEISSIYKQGDKLRRIHSLIFAPDFGAAEKFTKALVSKGCNLNADGRPIVGLSAKALCEMILDIDERGFLIPCHVWTPHFGVYGSASGFDSLEEAFGDMAPYVYGIETGISSDPGMNWQVSELANRSILSFSDAHSPAKMGREATVMELEKPSYENIRKAIMSQSVIASLCKAEAKQSTKEIATSPATQDPRNDKNHIAYTIEFYPEEGKYHYSGHRNCKVSIGPDEIREGGNICKVCNRKMTEGVLYRLQELSDEKLMDRVGTNIDENGVQWRIDKEGKQPPFVNLVPLLEVAAESLGSTVNSQKSKNLYAKLCSELGSELEVLLHASLEDIEKIGGGTVAQGVRKVRSGDIAIEPGYDGEYGKVSIWKRGEEKLSAVPQLKMEF